MLTEATTQLIKPGTLKDFCDAYSESITMVEQGFTLIASAYARMRIIERFNIIPQRLSDYELRDGNPKHAIESAKQCMQRSAWHELLRLTGVPDVMTQRKRDELHRAIEAGEVPPITFENVMALLNGMRGDLGRIVDDAIIEAARVLRPTNARYKTNGDGWQLGGKAIVEYAVESWGGNSFNLSYSRDAEIHAIDNAFHLLDGKGVPANPNRLSDAIRLAMQQHARCCETEYFRCKWFKNRNLHLEFKRQDLVNELNRRATDRSLRQPTA